jgi:hypothetical protein
MVTFSSSSVDVDRLELASADSIEHSLAGDTEGGGGLVESHPARRDLADDLGT